MPDSTPSGVHAAERAVCWLVGTGLALIVAVALTTSSSTASLLIPVIMGTLGASVRLVYGRYRAPAASAVTVTAATDRAAARDSQAGRWERETAGADGLLLVAGPLLLARTCPSRWLPACGLLLVGATIGGTVRLRLAASRAQASNAAGTQRR